MYTGQNIVKLAYGDRLIRPKSPKVKTLPIAYNITEAHTDFPIYIKPSSITGFGSLTLAEAQSLRFYADAGKTVELPREIVSADEIYVKNTLATGTGNKLYLDWDGVSPDYANNATYGRNNTRNSNYKAVYHFEGNANDSTSNQNNGTASNVIWNGDYATFNGTNSKILGSISMSTQNLTMQAIFNCKSTMVNQRVCMLNGDEYAIAHGSASGRWRTVGYKSGRLWQGQRDTGISEGNIMNMSMVATSSSNGMYLNGVSQSLSYVNGNSSKGIPSGTSMSQFSVGGYVGGTQLFNGDIYEIRFVASTLSSNRISTEYANQSNPATFFGTLS